MRHTCLLLFFVVAAHADEALQRFAYEKAEMGLPFRVTLYAPDEATAKAAADAAFARIAQLNSVFSDYDPDSELSRLSRTVDRDVPVTTDLWNVLERAQTVAAKTEGAFDITVGPLVNLWRNARRKRELPTREKIAEYRARVGWQKLRLDPTAKERASRKQTCGSTAGDRQGLRSGRRDKAPARARTDPGARRRCRRHDGRRSAAGTARLED
jgi:thiamine biosynthesis lipoprotein